MPLSKCEEVEKTLVFYLDDEVAPGERRLIEQHLVDCPVCQKRLAALAATRNSAVQALQGLAAAVEPSPQAWDLLQSRLAKEPVPAKNTVWNARPAPRAGRTPIHTFLGDQPMRTKLAIPALLAVVIMAVVGIFMTRNATPVSAQQILERAYQARNATPAVQGIEHIRIESYLNLQAMGGRQGVETTSHDSYIDLATGISRSVATDAATGKVLFAGGYDGSFVYTSRSGDPDEPVTIYRTPQSIDKVVDLTPGKGPYDTEDDFEAIRQNPDVTQVTEETWTDGRAVYVLRSQISEAAGQKYGIINFQGTNIMVFDANTYRLLESSTVMQQEGNEVVLSSYREVVNEVLPAGSPVAWDLSDVQGVDWVEDPNAEHGDLLPEVITPQELADRTQTGYLLKNVPEGFSLEISAPAPEEQDGEFFYFASYRTAEDDYFVLLSGTGKQNFDILGRDIYQTASGLKLYFVASNPENDPDEYVLAVVAVPEGRHFTITSSLPRERVEELAEDLVLVK